MDAAIPHILVDADACPVKDEIYKVALRREVPVTLLANSWLRTPAHPLIKMVTVSDGFDAADDEVVARSNANSVVVTADILLADRCLKVGAAVLSPTGKPFTQDSIGSTIATRAILQDLRDTVVGGPTGANAPFSKADRSRFLTALDTALAKLSR